MTDCGPLNRVSSMLLDKARGCVTCAESPLLPVDKVLENWCDKIRADFKQKSSINELKVVALPNTTAVPTTNTTATTTTATNPVAAPAPAPSPTVTTAAAPQPAPPQLPLRHGHVAEQLSKKKSMKKNDLRDHLAVQGQD